TAVTRGRVGRCQILKKACSENYRLFLFIRFFSAEVYSYYSSGEADPLHFFNSYAQHIHAIVLVTDLLHFFNSPLFSFFVVWRYSRQDGPS
ncbi:hypothetical protein, partial [Pedobacter antarcticus]|uniref:hypothetical protein n=1 Tax=Pedobacter antarcticus TaxID=34086 RepID=UPI001C40A79B